MHSQSYRGSIVTEDATDMTNCWCIGYCLTYNLPIAATGDSSSCLCGDPTDFSFDLYDEDLCDSPCPGNQSDVCGQYRYHSVYATGL